MNVFSFKRITHRETKGSLIKQFSIRGPAGGLPNFSTLGISTLAEIIKYISFDLIRFFFSCL